MLIDELLVREHRAGAASDPIPDLIELGLYPARIEAINHRVVAMRDDVLPHQNR